MLEITWILRAYRYRVVFLGENSATELAGLAFFALISVAVQAVSMSAVAMP